MYKIDVCHQEADIQTASLEKKRTSFSTQHKGISTLAFPFADDDVDVPTSIPKSHLTSHPIKNRSSITGKDTSRGKSNKWKQSTLTYMYWCKDDPQSHQAIFEVQSIDESDD